MATNRDNCLDIMYRKKNELLKRIEENKRLMELIKNPYIKDTMAPIILLRKIKAVKKIQDLWRRKCIKKKNNILSHVSPENNNIIKINYRIFRIQRAFRKYLSKKSMDKIHLIYLDDLNREFYSPLKIDKVNQHKNKIINNLKTMEIPNITDDLQEILNIYFSKYQKFNEDFPQHMQIRNDNYSKYYKSTILVNHLQTQIDMRSLSKFNGFYINQSKKEEIKANFNKIFDSIENKMWWYKYRDTDDFEENNILSEIDSHFNFSKIDDILSRGKHRKTNT